MVHISPQFIASRAGVRWSIFHRQLQQVQVTHRPFLGRSQRTVIPSCLWYFICSAVLHLIVIAFWITEQDCGRRRLIMLSNCTVLVVQIAYIDWQVYSGSMTETYRVLLHLSCEIIADCLVFDGCAQLYYFTFALFVSYLHHHSFSYFGSQYSCAKPSLYICFEFSEWCYYVTTFGFQNHILGLWHGDESWFWRWGHVINMTSSYAMWRWCQYTSQAGYLWTLCNVVDFPDSHHVWVCSMHSCCLVL